MPRLVRVLQSVTMSLLSRACQFTPSKAARPSSYFIPLFTQVPRRSVLRRLLVRCSRKQQLCLATPHVGKEASQIHDAGRRFCCYSLVARSKPGGTTAFIHPSAWKGSAC